VSEIVTNVVRQPWRALQALVTSPDAFDAGLKRQYPMVMLAPLLFLPLLSPATLALAVPVVLLHFLASRPERHAIVFQYTALVTPFLACATAVGLGNLLRHVGAETDPRRAAGESNPRGRGQARARRTIVVGLGLAALSAAFVTNVAYGPLSPFTAGALDIGRRQRNFPDAVQRALAPRRREMSSRVPGRGAVVASAELLAPLARRDSVHALHHVASGAFTYTQRPYPAPRDVSALVGDMGGRVLLHADTAMTARLAGLVTANRLAVVDAVDDLVVLVRGAEPRVMLTEIGASAEPAFDRTVFDGVLEYVGRLGPPPKVTAGDVVPFSTTWIRRGTLRDVYGVTFVLTDDEGFPVREQPHLLGYGIEAQNRWPNGVPVRDTYRLMLPRRLRKGTYRLGMTVYRVRWNGFTPATPAAGREAPTLDLGTIEVLRARAR
jgi:hypothetical protein